MDGLEENADIRVPSGELGERALATRNRLDDLVSDEASHTAMLTELELGLLLHLWRKRGSYVTREELLIEVWGYSPDTVTRTVDIFISRLRRMMGDGSKPKLLLTKRGQGYMLAGDEAAS